MDVDKKFTVTGIGEILWDLLPGGKKPGGAPANFAFHAQNLGANASIVSAVGEDVPGNEIINYFRELDLCTDFIQINQQKQTGVVNVKVNKGIPNYTIKNDVAWDFINWDPHLEKVAADTDAVCFGSLAQRSKVSRETIIRFLKSTRPDCLRVFDINLRQNFYSEEIITESLSLASVLKLNEDELKVVSRIFSLKGSENQILQKIIDRFELTMISLTKGEKYSFLKTKHESSVLEVPKIKVVDTVGAGDAFTAAVVMAKLYKKPLEEIHKLASNIAAFVCTQEGATPKLPDYLAYELIH